MFEKCIEPPIEVCDSIRVTLAPGPATKLPVPIFTPVLVFQMRSNAFIDTTTPLEQKRDRAREAANGAPHTAHHNPNIRNSSRTVQYVQLPE